MFNKILVMWGWALALIILFTSMVSVSIRVPFLWTTTSLWMLTVISTLIWAWIGIWVKWMFEDKWWDDNYDF